MNGRFKSTLGTLCYLLLWLVSTILITLTLFEVHVALIAVALEVVDNPTLRPTGWSTDSIHNLGRLLWLILGIFWLGWVIFTEGYLREGQERQILGKRAIRLLLIMGAIYFSSYILLILIS